MTLRVENPAWLWALLLLLPLSWVGLRWFSAMRPIRRWSAVLARAMLIALVVGMLAGAAVSSTTDRLAVVAVVDVSGSMSRFGSVDGGGVIEAVRELLAESQRSRRPDDLLGVVTFDARATAIASPTRGDAVGRGLGAGTAEGSDLERALRYAAALLPPDAAGRLVLVSDGVQTTGDAERAAREIGAGADRPVPIDVVPIRYEVHGETSVVSVDVPPRAAARSTMNVRIVLNSTEGSRGLLLLTREGEPVDINGDEAGVGRRIVLAPGPHVEIIPVELPDGRVHRFRAVFEPDRVGEGMAGDTVVVNNSADAVTATPGRGSVLVISHERGGPMPAALRAAGVDTTVLPPEGVPGDLLALQAYDAVILDNIPADEVREEQQALLSVFVRELGGGLVMIGGTGSFGAGGWKGSVLEPLLPVRLDLPDKLVEPDAAVMLVLDTSGSMNRPVGGAGQSQQDVANEAAARAIESLPKRDLVGVIAFSDRFRVVVRLAPNADPLESGARVRALSAMGGTSIGPALEEAGRQLLPVTASVKHVIVVSDGQSMNAEELPGLAQSLADGGIKVSTISVGDDADDRTMERMALRGGGTFYPVSNPSLLPRFFLKAVRVVRSPLVREGPFEPEVLPDPSPLTAGLDTPPPLLGLNLTQWRPEATVVHAMGGPGDEPLLAHWQVELGQVAAFTSDVGRWAQGWKDWPGFARLWVQMVRAVSRAAGPGRTALTVEATGEELRLRLEASGDDGRPIDMLAVPVSVYGPDGAHSEISLTQTAAGLYEGRLPARQSGAYVAVAKPLAGRSRLAPVLAGASIAAGAEYRALRSNEALMRRIAEVSGGRVLELADPRAGPEVFARTGSERSVARTPLWPSLLAWALGALLLDLGTRRIAWDRYLGVRTREERARAGPPATTRLAGRKRAPDPGTAEAPVLGEADARNVVARERERRLQQRLAALRGGGGTAPAPTEPVARTDTPPAEGTASLLEAKRRAREQFDEDGSG